MSSSSSSSSSRPKTASASSENARKPSSASRYDDLSERKQSGERTYTSGSSKPSTQNRSSTQKGKKFKKSANKNSAVNAQIAKMMGGGSSAAPSENLKLTTVAPLISEGFCEAAPTMLLALTRRAGMFTISAGEEITYEVQDNGAPVATLLFEISAKQAGKAGKVVVMVVIFDNTATVHADTLTRVYLLRGSAFKRMERGVLRQNVLKKGFIGEDHEGVAGESFCAALLGIVFGSEEFNEMYKALDAFAPKDDDEQSGNMD